MQQHCPNPLTVTPSPSSKQHLRLANYYQNINSTCECVVMSNPNADVAQSVNAVLVFDLNTRHGWQHITHDILGIVPSATKRGVNLNLHQPRIEAGPTI
jgi:hypothetical protein